MKSPHTLLTLMTAGVAAVVLFCGMPVIAHHSQAMFDTSQEILIEGTVHQFD